MILYNCCDDGVCRKCHQDIRKTNGCFGKILPWWVTRAGIIDWWIGLGFAKDLGWLSIIKVSYGQLRGQVQDILCTTEGICRSFRYVVYYPNSIWFLILPVFWQSPDWASKTSFTTSLTSRLFKHVVRQVLTFFWVSEI